MANISQHHFVYWSLLRHRPFRHLWFGQIFSQLAVNTLLFVLALRIYQNTGSNIAVSGLFLAHSIPAILFGVIAGTIVDRIDKRRMLVLCDALRGILTFGLLIFSGNLLIVYFVTFLNSVITQLYVPSEAPLIPRLTPKTFLVTANSLFAFTFYSSLAVGSILAGPLLRLFGSHGLFVVIAGMFWIAAYFSWHVPAQNKGTIGFRYISHLSLFYIVSRIHMRLIDGLLYVKKSATLFDAIILLTGTQIIFAILGSIGPGFADRVLGLDVRDASLFIVGPVVLGIVLGSMWVGIIGYRFTARRLINWGVSGVGFILLILYLSVFVVQNLLLNRIFVTALLFLLGIFNSMLDVPANATLQSETEGALRGRVYGILAAFVGGVGILPVIIGGTLADIIGVIHVVGVLGVCVIIYAIIRLRNRQLYRL